jgi:hypothetical protein
MILANTKIETSRKKVLLKVGFLDALDARHHIKKGTPFELPKNIASQYKWLVSSLDL